MWQLLRAGCVAVGTVAVLANLAAAPPVWQLAPYRVQALLALEATPELSALTPGFCQTLTTRVDALVGGPWTLSATLAETDLREALLAQPERIAIEALPQAALEADKVMLLGAGPSGNGYAAWARELDVRTRQFGPLVRLPAREPSQLCDTLVEALLGAFRPLGIIQKVEKEQVQLSLRAAALATRDRNLTLVGSDVAFEPWLPPADTAGGAAPLAPVAGAVLRVEKVQAEFTPAELESAAAVTLSAARGGGPEPLVLGTTARQRAIQAPAADADEPLRRQAETAALALDDELTDLVALREILLTQARSQLVAGRTADAKASLTELQALPTREQFTARVTAEQGRAAAGGSPVTQQRNQTLFSQLTRLAEQHLDAEPLKKLATDLEPPPAKKSGDKKPGEKNKSR